MKKPKVYALLANNRILKPTGGDKINEIRFYKALSLYFDVYYNGQLFQSDKEDFGIKDKEIDIPTDGYDLYYIRANNYVLKQCPRPKISMAYPYSHWLYHHVDALVLTTGMWKNFLEVYNQDENVKEQLKDWYNTTYISDPKKIVNIRQTIDTYFQQTFPVDEINKYKASFGWSNVIGYFGTLDMRYMPVMAFKAIERLLLEYPTINLVMAGKKFPDTVLPSFARKYNLFPYAEMPKILSACNCVLANEGAATEYLGSGKNLDAIAREVPIIAFRSSVRVEQLGDDYAGFYSTEEEAYAVIKQFITNQEFRRYLKKQVSERIKLFDVQAQGDWLRDQLMPLIGQN